MKRRNIFATTKSVQYLLDLHASAVSLNPRQISNVLTFVMYVVCHRDTGTYRTGYRKYPPTFRVFTYMLPIYISLGVYSCLYYLFHLVYYPDQQMHKIHTLTIFLIS